MKNHSSCIACFAFVGLGVALLMGGCKTGADLSELRLTSFDQKRMVEKMCDSILVGQKSRSGKSVLAVKPFRCIGRRDMVDDESLQWIESEIGTHLQRSWKFVLYNAATGAAPTDVLEGTLSCKQEGNAYLYCLDLRMVNASDRQAYWSDAIEVRKSVGD